jgi:tRNA G10  N-methylase Trm11
MDFFIKFAQVHETFRLPEIQALAIVENVDLTVLEYDESVCDARRAKDHPLMSHSHPFAS